MNRTKRTLSRVAGMALVLTGAASFAAGQASANDRAVVVSCTDQSAGTWEVSVTFSGIEVLADRPVQVTLGSDSTTLTQPGPDGTVTMRQSFGGDQSSASTTWSVVRHDYQNKGVLNLDRPGDCQQTPSTEAPPVTEVAPTTVPVTVLAVQVTPVQVTPVKAAVTQALPETGRPTMPMLALGAGAVVGGLGLVGVSRRRPEKA
jgi:LPXTG-motif cell wall-anchored protein